MVSRRTYIQECRVRTRSLSCLRLAYTAQSMIQSIGLAQHLSCPRSCALIAAFHLQLRFVHFSWSSSTQVLFMLIHCIVFTILQSKDLGRLGDGLGVNAAGPKSTFQQLWNICQRQFSSQTDKFGVFITLDLFLYTVPIIVYFYHCQSTNQSLF